MQLTLGRRWTIELEINVRLAKLQESCSQRASSFVAMNHRLKPADLKWEQDKIAGTMLSGWDDSALRSGVPDLSGPIGSRNQRDDLLARWRR